MIPGRTILLLSLSMAGMVRAEEDLESLMEKGRIGEAVKNRSEGVLLKDSTAVEQARAAARSRSEFGMELRPRVSDSDVGAALRIYLPSRWNQSMLREQLALVAQEEQLRVAALEWTALMDVYRGFCDFRMLNRQLEIYRKELVFLDPLLEKADQAVELNQLAVTERAKLYSLYLDLVNDEEKTQAALLELRQELQFLLGVNANLETMADIAVIGMPPRSEFDVMLKTALNNRSDFQLHGVHARFMSAAGDLSRKEDGFRLKYLQPDFRVDYNDGETSYGLTASFVLPWGTRNPDIAVYEQQRALSMSAMDLQRQLTADRLKVLLNTAEAYYAQAADRAERIRPLLSKLEEDLKLMDTGRLDELRDTLLVRERILDVSLQTTRALCTKERIAVDFAEELGTLAH